LDVNLRCQFGGLKPGIDWEEVEAEAQTILLDFRGEVDPELRRFKLLWVFSSLYEHIKRRGRREPPLALCIDEFNAMAHKVTEGVNPLATLLDEFIQQYLRNHNIWLTVAHQSIEQIDEQLQNTVLSLGTYIFGRAGTKPEAQFLADAIFKADPFWVKHKRIRRNPWPPIEIRINHPEPPGFTEEPEFMPLSEQLEVQAQRINQQGLFEFLCRPAIREGEVSTSVIPITIENVDRDPETGEYYFPDQSRLFPLRSLLETQSGIPVETILKEQEQRLLPTPAGNEAERTYPQRPQQAGQKRHKDTETSRTNPVPRPARTVVRRYRI